MRIAAFLALAATLLAPSALACVQPGCWTTGVYQYDGAGNLRAMGAEPARDAAMDGPSS